MTDSSGALVVGAEITLTDLSTNVSQITHSNDAGRYDFAVVNPGTYSVTVNKTGFRTVKVSNQVVTVGTPLTLNIPLSVGAATETVEVVATGTELQTMNATVGTTITHNEMLQMPNLSRDAASLMTLQPGMTPTGQTSGAVADQNSFTLDGGPITDDMSGDSNTYIPSFASSNSAGIFGQAGSGVIPTPVETIEEFRTSTTGQTADFNSSAGAEVVMATKRGTSGFHGSAYEYYEDSTFGGANSWSNDHVVNPKTGTFPFPLASSHFNRFGATAGGPITNKSFLGGKWFIFGGYEGFRFPNIVTEENSYPTALLRSGMMFVPCASGKCPGNAQNSMLVNLNPTITNVPTGLPASVYTAMGVTAGQPIPTTVCPGGPCDPRNLGLNSVICTASGNGGCSSGLWSQVPVGTDFSVGDGFNTAGYPGQLKLPQASNFGVLRIDHDFGSKWHFNATYHYYRLDRATTNQLDVGGVFPGDTFGNYTSTSNRPQIPWFYTAALTTDITSNITNSVSASYTRNWWAYETNGGVPNVAGYPAALEPGGETFNDFAPFNTDNQDTRTRYWNGKDTFIGDNLTWIRGNHLITLGGLFQHSNETHQRIDNGGFINIYEQYLVGDGNGTSFATLGISDGSTWTPSAITTNTYANYYEMILGIVGESQGLFTRQNGNGGLPLNPRSSCAITGVAASAGCISSPPALEQAVIDTYNGYANDSWHLRPSLTLTFGLGYTVEMPPFNSSGSQDVLVDASDNPVITSQYLSARQGAALSGASFDPTLGWATINNVNGHPKYPYNPFYLGLSPRVSVAWNPKFDSGLLGHVFGHDTAIRGGYSRIYGRLNGVDQILVPILAPGLMQTAQCFGPASSTAAVNPGGCGTNMAGAFRVGVDGTTAPLSPPSVNPNNVLPQPWFPGFNDVGTGVGEGLDPSFRPNRSDEFNLSVQRQLNRKVQFELGYIGRIIRNEYQSVEINAVPYMTTVGGQSFEQAWANLMVSTNEGANSGNFTVQPFMEAALGTVPGAFSPGGFCYNTKAAAPYASCTAAFVANENSNMKNSAVWSAWTAISSKNEWSFGRNMINDPITPKAGEPANIGVNGQGPGIIMSESNGYGNYNAGYFTLSFSDWHGLTLRSNLTYGHTLGTGAVAQSTSAYTVTDPFNLANMYGPQTFDQRLNYNLYFRYDLPFYRNQSNLAGKLLGGWAFTPLFTAGTGFPLQVSTTNGNAQSFGEGTSVDESTHENAVLTAPLNYNNSRNIGICGVGGIGTGSSVCQNVFTNPQEAFQLFRNPILGLDGDIGNFYLYGLKYWNLDATLSKNFKISERLSAAFSISAVNVLNHMQPGNPSLSLASPTLFGTIRSESSSPRTLEWGLRVGF